MIKLSNRLQSIADEVNMKTMVDIGTDHGFLPVYLWENNICSKVIMTDVSAGSLKKAKANCQNFYPDEIFDLRLGNGLEVVSPDEAEIVVMAGIGAPLIANIMAKDLAKTIKFKKFILQPRRHEDELRKWLDHNHFEIVKDKLVKERNLICQVLVVQYNPDYECQNYDYMFPDSILESDLAKEYLEYWMTKSKRNLSSAKKGDNQKSIEKWEKSIDRLNYLRGKLNEI